MKEAVLDLITSYENRISVVEGLISTVYQDPAASGAGLRELESERERLETSLRETLVKNCSLRRKDFDRLMQRVLSDSEAKKKEMEEEHRLVRKKLEEYLGQQKGLATSLRQWLAESTPHDEDRDSLKTIINEFRTVSQVEGEQVSTLLRRFQLHLEACQREQEELIGKLQRLVDRGESLRIEDLRRLEATDARQERRAERELRRREVERLLVHFGKQRQVSGRRRK